MFNHQDKGDHYNFRHHQQLVVIYFKHHPQLRVQEFAAGGEMVEPLDATNPANDQNIAKRTCLVEESEKLLVQQDIQFCASELLRGRVELSEYGAISDDAGISANPLPPDFNSFALPTDPAGTGGGTATGFSALGGQQTVFPVLPSLDPSSMGQSSVLLDLVSTGESGGDMGSGDVDAAVRLGNVSKKDIDAAKRFAHPPPLDQAVLNLPLNADAAAAALEIRETDEERRKRENIVKRLQDIRAGGEKTGGSKSRKTTKRTRRNKGRKSSSKTSKKTKQRRDRRSSRHRRSSRKGRK